MTSIRIIGGGRAGLSLAGALEGSDFEVAEILRRGDSVAAAASGVDLVVIATPDAVIEEVARAINPVESTVVAHMSGSLGLAAVEPHRLTAALHPLVALPDPVTGSKRLRDQAWFAIAGHQIAADLVGALGGTAFEVADTDRALYHAAAVIASNHLVALLGQAERICARVGVPFEAMIDLVRASVDNVAELGPATALTGPAARGDEETINRHIEALPASEREVYEVMADEARRLAQQSNPHQQSEGGLQ